MPPRISPIWEYFKEEEKDPSVAVCQVVGCRKPSVSRGKSGTARSNLTNSSMTNHMLTHHPDKYREFLESKQKVSEKRKLESENDDESELELSSVPIFNLDKA